MRLTSVVRVVVVVVVVASLAPVRVAGDSDQASWKKEGEKNGK